ncbi:MAG TPA: hypothetical protein VLC91_05415 [Spongiibacteraceae bacterium]|nr:hypothetical protein [Spongiibacteraceae bacterium]
MVAMPLYRTHSVAPEKLLMLSANVLQQAFFAGPRLDAKRRYQFLENGRTVFLIKVRMEDGSELEVNLRLDRSELRGKLNFSAFRELVGHMLVAQAQKLNEKQPLNVFSSEEQQRWVFFIPAVHKSGDVLNMLVLAIELSRPGELLLELMFIDPKQFEQQQNQPS